MTDSVRERFAAAAREERPDLAELCLLIGAEADPALDGVASDLAQIELDRLAGLLPYGLVTPAQWAQGLRQVLGVPDGVVPAAGGDPEPGGAGPGGAGPVPAGAPADPVLGAGFHGSSGDYHRLVSSLLQEVLRRRRGLPILLSVVWIEVARRAGAPVYGVALPGHFVVGLGDPAGDHVLVDPFAGGRVLSAADAELLVASTTGTALAPGMLTPADPLDIVQRILNNIRAWAAPRPERLPVQLWALDLTLLLPRHPAKLRYERAQLLVQMGDFLGGAAEMEEYAKVIAAFDPESAEPIRRQARAARARLN